MLSARVRLSVYLPDDPRPAYGRLRAQLQEEFTDAFGGATTRHVDGNYLTFAGTNLVETVSVIYTYVPLNGAVTLESVGAYADQLRATVHDALEEEVVLIVMERVLVSHAEA